MGSSAIFIFLNTVALFLASVTVHIIIWKLRLPARQMRALVIIFFLGFLAWLGFSLGRHADALALGYITLYYWSVSFCYIITYSAIEGDSPTLSIMNFIGSGGNQGRSAMEISGFMERRPFMGARLTALERSGLIRQEEGRFVIAGTQSLAFRVILGFRRVYGSVPKGG